MALQRRSAGIPRGLSGAWHMGLALFRGPATTNHNDIHLILKEGNTFSDLALLVGRQEEHPACKN